MKKVMSVYREWVVFARLLHLSQRKRSSKRLYMFGSGLLQMLLLLCCWYIGRLHPLTISESFLEQLITLLFILIPPISLGWFLLRAPVALWDVEEAQWLLTLPTSAPLLFGIAGWRQLKSLQGAGFLFLVLVFAFTGASQLSMLFFPLFLFILCLEIVLCCLCSLYLILFCARFIGKRRMRSIIMVIALLLSLLPTLIVVSIIWLQPLHVLMLLQPLFAGVMSLWSPFLSGARLCLEMGGLHVPTVIRLDRFLAEIGLLLCLLLLLWVLGLRIIPSGFQAGWESLQTSPDSFRTQTIPGETFEVKRESFLWHLAWKIPCLPSAWHAIIGFCWQDICYDWKRLTSVIVSSVFLLLAFSRLSFSGIFVPLTIFTLGFSINSLLVRTIGLPLLSRILLARSQLRLIPIRVSDIFFGALLAVLQPTILLDGIFLICLYALLRIELWQMLLITGAILMSSAVVSLVSIVTGAFAIENQASGMRISAGAFCLCSFGFFMSAELLFWRMLFNAMEPKQQYITTRLFKAFFHIDISSSLGMGTFIVISLLTCFFILLFSRRSWKQIQKNLYGA